MITVEGLAWCSNGPMKIGRSSFTSNILCTTHNSQLSPIDEGGTQASEVIQEVLRIENSRENGGKRRHRLRRWNIDGSLLEAWLLKTTINLFHVVGESLSWSLAGANATDPPDEFLSVLFGHRPLPRPRGLYFVTKSGEHLLSGEHLGFAPLFNSDRSQLVGSLFQFRWFRMLLWLSDLPVPKNVGRPHGFDRSWWDCDLKYHLKKIQFLQAGKKSQIIRLRWE